MSETLNLPLALALALGLAFAATPVAIRVADRLDFYDRPASGYKGHARPTPYLGGAAVLLGFLLTMLVVGNNSSRTVPLVVGAGVLWAVGTLDDRHGLPWSLRVGVEASLACLLWDRGLGWHLGLGAGIDLVVTVFWVVAVINAFNLFDNMDGAASSMVIVVSLGVAVLGAAQGDTWLMLTATALGGACLGFLPHNLTSPARIFLGDGGSMPLGFAVALVTMVGASEAVRAVPALLAGLLLVGVPAFDTFLVVVSRRRRGISILTGGNDHLTHRARHRLRTARAVAITLSGAQALLCVVAVFATEGGSVLLLGAVLAYLAAAGAAFLVVERNGPGTLQAREAMAERENAPVPRLRHPALSLEAIVLGALGLGLGLSPLFGGFYDSSIWVPMGAGLLVLLTAASLARTRGLSRPAWIVLAALLGSAAWALISSQWADSVERALVEGNRTLVYFGLVACLVLLARTRQAAKWLLVAVGLGIAAVVVSVCWRMLGSHAADLFAGGRLNLPLGYVNVQGTFFLMGLWLSLAVAEQRRGMLAGMAAGAATLLGCLALMSQSRGVAVAALGSIVIVLLAVPGRLRRAFALLAVLAGVAVAAGPIIHIYKVAQTGALPTSAAHTAMAAALLSALVVGLVWGAAASDRIWKHVAARGFSSAKLKEVGLSVLVVLVLAGASLGVARASSISRSVSAQWHAFIHLNDPSSASATQGRLLSGAGNRYDYWSVAWDAFTQRPLGGFGAGNYDVPYFAHRHTTEDVRQPHSIEMQYLSELGIVGFSFLVLFAVGLALGARRMIRAARTSAAEQTLAVACIGGLAAWFIHTSVDWVHLIPGVTGIALAFGAIMLRGEPARAPGWLRLQQDPVRRRWLAAFGAVAASGVVVFAALSLTRQGLAEAFANRARAALATNPAKAIRDANSSLRLDPYLVETYYTKAAGLAQFNRGDQARQTLLVAAGEEPRNFVTWALLGDVSVRMSDFSAARVYYGRAHALNPRDPTLAASARDPAGTSRSSG